MTRQRRLSIGLCVALILPACGGGATSSTDSTVATSAATTTSIGDVVSPVPDLLVEVGGDVALRRAGWADFLPVSLGTGVRPGDLLRVAEGGAAAVFCGDEVGWDNPPIAVDADGSPHGVPCPSGRPPRPWADVAALRGAQDLTIPYVVRPRNTLVLDPTPNLRWHPVEGVGAYSISLLSDDAVPRPAVEVSSAATDWPDAWAPMQPGATYILIVDAEGRHSDDANPGHVGLGFSLATEDVAERIRTQATRLEALGAGTVGRDLVLAELYLSEGLLADATQLLEGVDQRSGSAAVLVALARAHLTAGAVSEARSAFLRAHDEASTVGELEAQAQALVGIGLTDRAVDDEAAAADRFTEALDLYLQVGDQEAADEVSKLLDG